MKEHPKDHDEVMGFVQESNESNHDRYLRVVKRRRQQLNAMEASTEKRIRLDSTGVDRGVSHQGVKVIEGDKNKIYSERHAEDGLPKAGPVGKTEMVSRWPGGTRPPTAADMIPTDMGREM